MQANYADIDVHLRLTPFEPFELFQDQDGKCNARRGNFVLHVEKQTELLSFTSHIDTLYVYGIGLGHHLYSVEAWLTEKSSRVVVILEDDLGVLDAFWKTSQEILNHPQVFLKFIPHSSMWDSALEDCAKRFSSAHIQVIALPSYARKKSSRLRQIKLSLQRKTVLWNALLSEELLSPLFHRNILQNILHLPETFYVNKWQGIFKGTPAIICGAGPSLAEAQDILKTCEEKALILAAGSAISALGALNIQPHFALAIDPNPQEYEHLKHLKCPDTPLIFSSRLFPKVLDLFSGPLGYLSSKTGGPLEAHLEAALGLDELSIGPSLGREALSITTLTAALAYAWGCNPIIFVGVDLSYAGMQMYAPGVVSTGSMTMEKLLQETKVSDQLIVRKNRQGNPVATLVKWIMESDTLSQYAKERSDRQFFDASARGLGFTHIPYKNLGDILQEYAPRPRNLRKEIQKNIEHTQLAISSADIEKLFSRLQESLKRCLTLTQKILEERLNSGTKIVLEMDLEEEEAYKPFLAGTLFAFELAYRHSFLIPEEKDHPLYLERASNFERARWMHLKECIEKEITSLDGIEQACF
ncbi:MAG: DUF115 domain-containing protein [Rhabdochlamydiaceae bacterium]|jgi:hypothetical protein